MDWRRLDWLPDYEISEHGHVRRATKGRTRRKGLLLKGFLRRGYLSYKLVMPDGSKRKFSAHRLVCEAWHGPPPLDFHGAHSDGVKAHNHYSNLAWKSPIDNGLDVRRHGRLKGNGSGRAVLTDAQVAEIRATFTGAKGQIAELARLYQMSKSGMRSVCRGETWNG